MQSRRLCQIRLQHAIKSRQQWKWVETTGALVRDRLDKRRNGYSKIPYAPHPWPLPSPLREAATSIKATCKAGVGSGDSPGVDIAASQARGLSL